MSVPLEQREDKVGSAILPLERWPSFRRKLAFGVIKTGFKVNPDDHCELLPDPEQIYWLEKAFDFIIAGTPLREVADWLSQKIHRSVNYQTLSNSFSQYRKPFHKGKTHQRRPPDHSKETLKLISAKVNAHHAVRKAIKLEKEIELKKKKIQPDDWSSPRAEKEKPPEYTTNPDDPNKSHIKVLFQPNEGPQFRFLEATEEEILYGGAAGGEDKVFLPPPFLVIGQNKTRELLECPS